MIVPHTDPILKQVCTAVPHDFGPELDEIAATLRRAMQWSADQGRPAMGLAAPQVGIPLRLFVLRDWPHPFINPTLVEFSEETAVMNEGCLSFPENVLVPIRRPLRVRLRAFDLTGQRRTFKHRGTDARAVFHELDHLDGVLITDRYEAAA